MRRIIVALVFCVLVSCAVVIPAWSQSASPADEVKAVCAMVLEGLPSPIPLAELAATTRTTFRIMDSLRTGERELIS